MIFFFFCINLTCWEIITKTNYYLIFLILVDINIWKLV